MAELLEGLHYCTPLAASRRVPGSMRYMEIVRTIAAVVSAIALVVIAGATLRLLGRQNDLLRVEHFQSGCLRSITVNLQAEPGSPQLACPQP